MNLSPSIRLGLLIITRFETKVENPGARHDWAIKPSLSSLRQTAWSSRFQSQPRISNNMTVKKPDFWHLERQKKNSTSFLEK